MGTLFGFIVGYVVGATAGAEGFDRFMASVRAVRDSDEFHDLVASARGHSRQTMARLLERLVDGDGDGDGGGDVLERARSRLRG